MPALNGFRAVISGTGHRKGYINDEKGLKSPFLCTKCDKIVCFCIMLYNISGKIGVIITVSESSKIFIHLYLLI